MKKSQDLLDALKDLLKKNKASTQDDICKALENKGYSVNQTKVSRLLRQIGAVKVVTAQGQIIYSLLREPAPPKTDTLLSQLILDIVSNETMIVIFTSPGSASMIARLLDYEQVSTGILGTIAGDDTIFVAPKSIQEIPKIVEKLKSLLLR